MEKEKIPTLKPRKGCKHENSDPMYARGGQGWTSTYSILGYMVHVCYDCGAFFRKEETKIDVVEKEGEQC